MAAGVNRIILCVTGCVLFCLCFGGPVLQDLEISVPHDVGRGYVITKVKCPMYRVTVTSPVKGVEIDAPDVLSIDKSDFLITNTDISSYIDHLFTVYSKDVSEKSGYTNKIFHIRVTHSNDTIHFNQRVYNGYIYENNEIGDRVIGIYMSIIDLANPNSPVYYTLAGADSESFVIRPDFSRNYTCVGLKINRQVLPQIEKSEYHFIVNARLKSKNREKGQANINIKVLSKNYSKDTKSKGTQLAIRDSNVLKYYPVRQEKFKMLDDLNLGEASLDGPTVLDLHDIGSLGQGNQKLSEAKIRRRRATEDITENIPENAPDFTLAKSAAEQAQTYELIGQSNVFSVASNGVVTVLAGALDYETPEKRTYTFLVQVTNGTVVKTLRVTVAVTDVNDEAPYFTNQPVPYLAVVNYQAPPGTLVYTLTAMDPDANSDIRFSSTEGQDRFAVHAVDGENGAKLAQIRTIGDTLFTQNAEYTLSVKAIDRADTPRNTKIAIVKIMAGQRAPQFMQDPYQLYVLENSLVGHTLSPAIEAKSFQDSDITYQVFDYQTQDTGSAVFSINHGVLAVKKKLDYETDPHTFRLIVRATEVSSRLTSTVQVDVSIQDMNEYDPEFTLSAYTITIKENTAVGADILQVSAKDEDLGSNITYSVKNENFVAESRDNVGHIIVNKGLDYDRTEGHKYSFTVYATDSGSDPRSGTATVNVILTNVNDEAPEFTDVLNSQLYEDAATGSAVITVKAIDYDGDRVKYYFTGTGSDTDPTGTFQIRERSGVITLFKAISTDAVKFLLNVTAEDDGSCCSEGNRHSSEAVVTIEIIDSVNSKPSFPDCASYNHDARIKEEQEPGEFVIQVSARDTDRGDNGKLEYSIVTDPGRTVYFTIDSASRNVTTARKIDREMLDTQDLGVFVQAKDKGNPPQSGFCFFLVTIDDINDNPPEFGDSNTGVTVSQGEEINRSILLVKATDKDIGDNRRIEYLMTSNPGNYFRIDPDTGSIFTNKSLADAGSTIELTITARDHGTPPLNTTLQVTVTISNDPNIQAPSWNNDYDNEVYTIPENAAVTTIIAQMGARSNLNNPAVTFNIMNQNMASQILGPFKVLSSGDSMNLTVFDTSELDVDKLVGSDSAQLPYKAFKLHLRVTNQADSPLSKDTYPTVHVTDVNDEVPQFTGLASLGFYDGSVAENQPADTSVTTVVAQDSDRTHPNNEVIYSIATGEDLFTIGPSTGEIKTKQSFDREMQKVHYITVMAKDGAASAREGHIPMNSPNSATATVKIDITDVNDNQPTFAESFYNATVAEDAPSQFLILTVTASDKDEGQPTYSIDSSNSNDPFRIMSKTGAITVARTLDYEGGDREFTFTVVASDGKYTDTTTVAITVTDVNDNMPKFSQDSYLITSVTEEDKSITRLNPKSLVTVSATDADRDREITIHYMLRGYLTEPPDPAFSINEITGEVSLLTHLDRDKPNGQDIYQFNVLAVDEPGPQAQTGFASVQVKLIDINDNSPIFDEQSLQGLVPEHSDTGAYVMTISANDFDAGENSRVTYNFVAGSQDPNFPSNAFKIDPDTGEVTTLTDQLDRENIDKYILQVKAVDHGDPVHSATGNVVITITDTNDNKPEFSQKLYTVNMSENAKKGVAVITVTATDLDINENAKLYYGLVKKDNEFFTMETESNTGVLKVYKEVNYDIGQKFFNLTATVRDNNEQHRDVAYIEVTVEDFNDNAPEFVESHKEVHVKENTPVNTVLANFTATDADSTVNAEFDYFIAKKSDPGRQFGVDKLGNVFIKQELDYETVKIHYVQVLAIDRGYPPQTGTATLTCSVQDVNDNYPIFAEKYHPIVMENKAPGDVTPLIRAIDKDEPPFGPPFQFMLPTCDANPTCPYFDMEFDSSGEGVGKVRSLETFDREETKLYRMPIIMSDMRGVPPPPGSQRMTGTNTLTIEIGDINDNHHFPGYKEIHVLNYKGAFGNIEIGTVHAEDKDDWDIVDKTFSNISPAHMNYYFSVDSDTGMVTLKPKVPYGEHIFHVDVYDTHFHETQTSKIKVIIEDLPAEAVYNSGSVRLAGITAEEFIQRNKTGGGMEDYGESKYDKFLNLLTEKLGKPKENVLVVSIMNNEGFTDVRYAAHGSPWYPAGQVDAVVYKDKTEFEEKVDINIAMVAIDECMEEICEAGCFNDLVVTEKPNIVNTNGTSFVAVQTRVDGNCGCRARNYSYDAQCTPDYCYNGGTCVKDDWNFVSCSCPADFDGPRCQNTRKSFLGTGYGLYGYLEQCENSRTNLEFLTDKENGLLLYNGPVEERDSNSRNPSDFISLTLKGGYPELRIDHGSGELILTITGRNIQGQQKLSKLNDKHWHRIDVIRTGKDVKMIVDHCRGADVIRGDEQDRTFCEAFGTTRGENTFLNVNTPLQLGGRYKTPTSPSGISSTPYTGCIRNLEHNGELYDLSTSKASIGVDNGCPYEDDLCGVNSIDGPKCGPNGVCEVAPLGHSPVYRCICNPGYRGTTCLKATTEQFLYASNSYIDWALEDSYDQGLSSLETEIQLTFRTRKQSGLVFSLTSDSLKKFIRIQISSGKLEVQFNLGGGDGVLELSYVNVADGHHHTVKLQRFGKEFIMKLDGGENRFYNDTLGNDYEHYEINIRKDQLFAGAFLEYPQGLPVVLRDDLRDTCFNDIRLESAWFPMSHTENNENSNIKLQNIHGNRNNCSIDDCAVNNCGPQFVCVPLWGLFECRCRAGYVKQSSACVPINYCQSNPCFGDATCNNNDVANAVGDDNSNVGFTCMCPPGWTGSLCNSYFAEEVTEPGLTEAGIAILIVAIIVLIVIAVALMLFFLLRGPADEDKEDKPVLDFEPDDEDIRENIVFYDEEGAGEEDQDGYDIRRLRKPEAGDEPGRWTGDVPDVPIRNQSRPLGSAPGKGPMIGDFIDDRLTDAEDDPSAPPYDTLRDFGYEGAGSDAGTLSSLNTTTSGDQDYDYLNDWGPKFAKLADMYNQGGDDED